MLTSISVFLVSIALIFVLRPSQVFGILVQQYSQSNPNIGAPMIRIDTTDATPIYRQVIDQVKMLVITGQLRPGDQLESVSQLSARLKVNPMTVSKAFSALVSEGVAERRRGVGIFVAAMDSKQADIDRRRVLSHGLSEAAALVVRMGVDPDKAVELFRQHIRDFENKQRSPQE